MRDEARNTAHSHGTWGQDAKLRTRPVAFISAGLIEPLKNLSLEDSDGEDDSAKVNPQHEQPRHYPEMPRQEPPARFGLTAEADAQVLPESATISPLPVVDSPQPTFFIDKTGDKSLSAGNNPKPASPRPASPGEHTDSSEEVILFKGRNAPRAAGHSDTLHDEINIQIQTVTERIADTSLTRTRVDSHHVQNLDALHSDLRTQQDDEDAIIADYIANMADADDDDEDDDEKDEIATQESVFNTRDLGASDEDVAFDDSLSSSDDDIGDEEDDDDGDNAEDEEEPGESPVDQVDDEQLAKILAKQEELGLGGDDVMLFSAEYTAGAGRSSHGRTRRRKGSALVDVAKSKRNGRSNPSASALADAFDEFDLMDWGRSNPQLKTKGKRGQVAFDVSDSELDAALQDAWQKDRATKADKKRAREELRAQGLLGSKANPDDPRTKYQDGMSMEDIKGELRTFLLGSDTV